jgi:hypothetical protein
MACWKKGALRLRNAQTLELFSKRIDDDTQLMPADKVVLHGCLGAQILLMIASFEIFNKIAFFFEAGAVCRELR